MEIKKYFIVFLASLISFLTNGQAPVITSQKCFGGTDADIFNSVSSYANAGYLIGGGTLSLDGDVTFNHGGGDLWFIKTDSAFGTIWQKCFGGSGGESGGKVLQLNNSKFIFAGGTASNNGDVSGNHQTGTYDGWLAEIDSSGSLLFQKCYGGSGGDAIQSLIQTYDGGYLMVGSTSSSDGDLLGSGYHGSSDGWILKIDSSKNIEWGKCIGGTFEDGLVDIFSSGNSNYIISGISYSSDGDVSNHYGGYDFWLIQIDSLGNIIWDKSYGGSQNDILTSMVKSNDGGYILGGKTSSHDGLVSGIHDTVWGLEDYWVIKVDSIGNLIWQKCLGGIGYDNLYNLVNDMDNGYIISGLTQSNDGDVFGNHGNADIWLTDIDSNGTLLWQKCIGGSDGEYATVCNVIDSNYIVAGITHSYDGDVTNSFNHGNGDAWVVKLAQLPNDVPSLVVPLANLTGFITSSILHLNYSVTSELNIQLQIFDIPGRLLFEKTVETVAGKNELVVPIGEVKTGVYMVRIGNEVFKVIVN